MVRRESTAALICIYGTTVRKDEDRHHHVGARMPAGGVFQCLRYGNRYGLCRSRRNDDDVGATTKCLYFTYLNIFRRYFCQLVHGDLFFRPRVHTVLYIHTIIVAGLDACLL